MSIGFENSIIDAFSNLNTEIFKVNQTHHRLFICGGEVNHGCCIPPSFRHRFLEYIDLENDELGQQVILAETFKDYLKENAYPDLLVFEDEIASLSSLVVIFLESPGALVELGMFCTKPNFYNKLLIVANIEETKTEDSFIFLGPLQNIRKKSTSSVAIYPWPDPNIILYEKVHLLDLLESAKEKLSVIPKRVKFKSHDTGHVSKLIAEIVRLSYPVVITDVQWALESLEIDVPFSQISRSLYLLEKLDFVSSYDYGGGYKYYYPVSKDIPLIWFGSRKDGRQFDEIQFKLSIKQSYISKDDSQSRKRKAAGIEIKKIFDGRPI